MSEFKIAEAQLIRGQLESAILNAIQEFESFYGLTVSNFHLVKSQALHQREPHISAIKVEVLL